MKRHLVIVLTAVTFLGIEPSASEGSILPDEVTLRLGPSETSTVTSPGFSSVYTLHAGWPIGRRSYLWSSASYFGQRIQWDQTSGYTPSHYSYQNDFVPLALGVRLYWLRVDAEPRGPFVEAGPSFTLARYQSRDLQRHVGAMGGFQAGAGLRFPGFGHTRAEVGVSYYMAQKIWMPESIEGRATAFTGERMRRQLDANFATAYLAVGIGH